MSAALLNTNPYVDELNEALKPLESLEEKIDRLRSFKKSHTKPLESAFLQGEEDLNKLGEHLSQLAEAILIKGLELAWENVRTQWGLPRYRDNTGQFASGEIALIGMGKLGGRELHFGSDLDIIFVFNRNGESHGGKVISNQEYFSKVAQRLISYLTLHTREGVAYSVDTELRPSGNAGALVTGLDTWMAYYHEHAQTWEKQALLKARLVHATGNFKEDWQKKLKNSGASSRDSPIPKERAFFHSFAHSGVLSPRGSAHFGLKALFQRLIFLKPFGSELAPEMHHLRLRIEKELAKESETRWHLKKGLGALMDIEFAVQYLQLHLGNIHPKILSPNTPQALEKIHELGVLKEEDYKTFCEAYTFYRRLEIFLELKFDLKEAWINPTAPWIEELSTLMGMENVESFLEYFQNLKKQVREIYLKVLKINSSS